MRKTNAEMMKATTQRIDLRKMRFTAIDFETASVQPGSVCSVGLAIVENGMIVDRVFQLIRPEPLFFDPFNVAIHGISEAAVADAPTFGEYWPALWARVSGPLVAHNAAFDMSVLRRALDQAGIRYPETDYFCTRVISRLAWPGHSTYALDHLARAMGISFRHHDAAEDAGACALIAIAACEQAGAASLHDLQEAFGLRVGSICSSGYRPCGAPRRRRSSSRCRDKRGGSAGDPACAVSDWNSRGRDIIPVLTERHLRKGPWKPDGG